MTAPEGPISLALNYLRLTLADTARWRTMTGATGASAQAQALTHVHHVELPTPENGGVYTIAELRALRPFAILWSDPQGGFGMALDAVSDGYEFAEYGRHVLRLEVDVPEALKNNHAEVLRRLENNVGVILTEMAALAGTAGYLAINAFDLEYGPYRAEPDIIAEQGDFAGVEIGLAWGAR